MNTSPRQRVDVLANPEKAKLESLRRPALVTQEASNAFPHCMPSSLDKNTKRDEMLRDRSLDSCGGICVDPWADRVRFLRPVASSLLPNFRIALVPFTFLMVLECVLDHKWECRWYNANRADLRCARSREKEYGSWDK